MRAWQQLKNIYHYLQAQFWRTWYARPDRALVIYGVTGTNGKTTTCHMAASILQQAHGRSRVGMLTTIAFWIGEEKIVNQTKMTTLPSRQVFSYLRQMRSRGVTHVVLELTSHALDQHRLAGITLHGAIILNIAREHLDYHGTMSEYAAAKEKIVALLAPTAPLVGKADDPLVNAILDRATARGVTVVKFTGADASAVASALPGAVNQENACAAKVLLRASGVSEQAIAAGLAAVSSVPGRMQWLTLPTGAKALIDYAVTPDALARLYQDLRRQTTGKIFAVLGAAGLRDRGKRPLMAQAVAQFADEVVITREDPWTESEAQIFSDLESGLAPAKNISPAFAKALAGTHNIVPAAQGKGAWQRIIDRRQALRYCIAHAQTGDVIVATGKGAETGMGIGKKVEPWNEPEIIQTLAREVAAERDGATTV